MPTLTIDNQTVTVEEGTSVLEAARKIGVDIPTLCYLKDLNAPASCRVCLVQVEGRPTMDASCVLPAAEGMVVHTNTPPVLAARKQMVELLLSDHPFECLACERNLNCELQRLAKRFGIRDLHLEGSRNHYPIDDLSPSVVREPDKCIRCRRCIAVCENFQSVGIYRMVERSFNAVVGPAFNGSLMETPCIYCGQCITVCPTGALREQDSTARVWEALQDPDLFVIVQTAPAIRSTIGEEFGYPVGSLVTGQMVATLRRLGFDRVFDDCFGADVTVMEEAKELAERLERGGPFPQFTACCPSWVLFCESFYPQLIDNLSEC
ncbi:MAG: 4Fe-4S binding protein, partial [Firmicutes bacterium]|nr:4Fe-4S binding protein [Bacillota bacterium]